MASVKLYLDKRTKKTDGTSPVKVLCSYRGLHTYFSTGISVTVDQYDQQGGKNGRTWIKNTPRMDSYNRVLYDYIGRIESALFQLGRCNWVRTEKDLKNAVTAILEPQEEQDVRNVLLKTIVDKFLKTRKGRTVELYQDTITRIERYTDYDSLLIVDITPSWLVGFHSTLLESGNSINTIAIHERNIRAIFNFAINEDERLLAKYPFRKYKIKTEDTPYRTLTAQDIATLATYECESYQEIYRDMFLLSFYLIGINPVDLFSLKPTSIVGNRVEYRRAKTGKLYSIALPDVAKAIVERYKGKEYLLSVQDKWNIRNFLRACNIALKNIGEVQRVGRGGRKVRTPLFPGLTMYWARYSWANIAHRLGVPKDTISMALGHSFGVKVTDVYIDYDSELVDNANRLVIEHIKSLIR